jgi:threonine-phosphate decarboxylase
MLYETKNPHGGDVYGGDVTLDFSANINPFGTPEAVREAVRDALDRLDRYPDPYCRELVAAIAAAEQVPERFILCGNGAAELIYAWCRAAAPRTALLTGPTFLEYDLALGLIGCRRELHLLRQEEDFVLTASVLDTLEAVRPDAVFLCDPNNPTGQRIDPTLMEELLVRCRGRGTRVFVDECFADLCDDRHSLSCRLEEFPNLLVLKAFTKSYGMAGLRLGYGLSADGALLGAMAASVQPWNVSTPAQAAGVAALGQADFLEKTRGLIRAERPRLRAFLESMGWYVCPSLANFLLFRGPEDLGERLRRKGVAIRDCANYPGLGRGWYRIAVRQREENDMLMAAIGEAVGRDTTWQ